MSLVAGKLNRRSAAAEMIVSTLTAEGHRTKRGCQRYPPAIASLLDTERA